ncbi:hypothetical protein BC940DRAFT_293267 [Gongronella butleri]|nr:hypothetical protein BC940DRAFT_293267 [Gongronella butleri]
MVFPSFLFFFFTVCRSCCPCLPMSQDAHGLVKAPVETDYSLANTPKRKEVKSSTSGTKLETLKKAVENLFFFVYKRLKIKNCKYLVNALSDFNFESSFTNEIGVQTSNGTCFGKL